MHLATSGHVEATDVGQAWDLTPKMLEETAANFTPEGTPVLINIGHVDSEGTYSESTNLGRVLGVTCESAYGELLTKELWGLVELHDIAAARIAHREWVHASPAIMLDALHESGAKRGVVLLSIGLTNSGLSIAGRLDRMTDP